MKLKLCGGILCACSVFLAQPPRLDAQTTAPPAAPAAQTPPAQQAQPQAAATAPPPSSPKPPAINLHDTGGDAYSIEPLIWLTKEPPNLLLGLASKQSIVDPTTGIVTPGQSVPGNLQFPGQSPYALGAVITIPTTHENSIQLSGFRLDGHGDTTETQNLILFGNAFTNGDLLLTTYRVQNLKLSWNYLTYPYPSRGAKLRIKTLWEVQYTGISTVVNAPNDINAIPTAGVKDIIYPTFGLGVEYHPAKAVRLEAKASGFGFPHHADLWDIEGSVVVRVGPFEALGGGKGYHFKTSPDKDQYFAQTLWGPYVGLRWIWR